MGTFSPSGKQMFVLLVPDQEMTVENQPNISKDEIKKEIVEKRPLMSAAIAAITKENGKVHVLISDGGDRG